MLVQAGEPVTVTDLARRLGQHPNTVREHLDVLVADRLAERLRSTPTGRGRPAWLYCGRSDTSAAGAIGGEYAALALALIDELASSSPDPRERALQAGARWGRGLAARVESTGAVERHTAHVHGADVDPGSVAGDGVPDGFEGGDDRDEGVGGGTEGGDGVGDGIGDDAEPDANPRDAVLRLLTDLRFEPEWNPRTGIARLTACPLLDAARMNPDLVCTVHLGIVRGALEYLGGRPDDAELVPFAEPGACLLRLPESS